MNIDWLKMLFPANGELRAGPWVDLGTGFRPLEFAIAWPELPEVKLGYARVSKGEGNLEIQLEALRTAGAVRIWQDHDVSGSAVIKPGFMDMLAYAKPGDEIIVWRLDRLSRSLITLMIELEALGNRQVEFRSLAEAISTNAEDGGSFFHAVAAFRSFERDVLQERADAEQYTAGN